jgi:hypothetical protein
MMAVSSDVEHPARGYDPARPLPSRIANAMPELCM